MRRTVFFFLLVVVLAGAEPVFALSDVFKDNIFDPGTLPPTDSTLKVTVGKPAPDFTLKAVSGKTVSLKDYYGKKNVVISFVPAAWTPVCSDQWPGYNIAKDLFESNNAVLLGITVDNIPTLYAWTRQMGTLWFEVLSDFFPHGEVADRYGVLRSDGVSERAVFIIDRQGILRYAHVEDINRRPELGSIIRELEKLQ